ncbi:NAD(P)-binding protein [Viridothelium virens]|uniref:NAD(P)-binding protein n=1 Tax=Viridothelium virens TaxID=1048519 RepID=A0A6A6H5K6_VIRVR|nr:NAD(P)-binding protein [Viridothelium virens]
MSVTKTSQKAASGIGEETAIAFAEAGCRGVVFADFDENGACAVADKSKEYAKHPSYRGLGIRVDVTDESSVENMAETTFKEFGRIDYSVNSAGACNDGGNPTSNQELEPFEKVLKTNVTGIMLCVRAVSKIMAKQEPRTYSGRKGERSLGRGSIVNVGSLNSNIASPGLLPYVTSKFAVMGITKTAALDLMSSQVRVNAVCPGWVDTPLLQGGLQRNPKIGEYIQELVPHGRIASPEEIADYIVFACSPSASYINGTGTIIDAGLSLTVHRASL